MCCQTRRGLSINSYLAKLFYLNFHTLEVMSRQRDPQLQVGENYSYLIFFHTTKHSKSRCLNTHFIPNICDINLLVKKYLIYFSADDYTTGYMPALAMVSHDGHIFWPPIVKLRSTCQIDITYFPFDDQTCSLKLGSWAYDGFQVNRPFL